MKRFNYVPVCTDWKGNALSAEQIATFHAGMPECRHCGETINRADAPREGQQTEREVRLLLGIATHVLTYGGLVPVDCWLEHNAFARRYIRYELVEDRLFERPYPDDRPSHVPGIFSIWPLVSKDYAF